MPKTNPHFHLTVLISVLTLTTSIQVRGQHTAALKVHALSTIHGLYNIGYEQAFNNHISAEFSLQGGHYINHRLNRFETYKVSGIGAVGAFRYYPFAKKVGSPQGFFGFGALRYIDYSETFLYTTSGDRYKVGGNIINAGAGVGYKFAYRRIGLEAFLGWGTGRLKSNDDEERNNVPEFHRKSIEEQERFPQLDLGLCYMFSPFFKEGRTRQK